MSANTAQNPISHLARGDMNLMRSPTETSRINAPNYIRERSAGEIIRESLRIYKRHCLVIFLIYVPLAVATKFTMDVVELRHDSSGVIWTARVLNWVIPYIAALHLTVVISHIYQGYDLKLTRILRRTFPLLGKALITGLLVLLLFFLYPWLMFSTPVVMIEGVWGFKALRRSWELGKYYRLRNFFVYVWPFTLYVVVYVAINLVFFYLSLQSSVFTPWELAFSIVKDIAFSLIAPMLIIIAVLLYYDMRIRNEAYDIASLAEDLRI